MWDVNLSDAKLECADLRGAKFGGDRLNLSRTSFKGANISDVRFHATNATIDDIRRKAPGR